MIKVKSRSQRLPGLLSMVIVATVLGACSGDQDAPTQGDVGEAMTGATVFSVTGDMLELCKDYGGGDSDEDRVRDLGCELLVSVGFDNARINTGLDPQGLCRSINNVDVNTVEFESIETATRFALAWMNSEPARAQALTVEMLQLVFLKNNPFCPRDLAGASPKPIKELMENVTVTAEDFMAYCSEYGQAGTVSGQIRDYACTLYVAGTADYLRENATDVPGGYCLDDAKDVDYLMTGVFDYILANRGRLKNVDGFATVMSAVRTQAPCDVVTTQ